MTRTRRASMVFAVCAWFVTASQERVADFRWVASSIGGQRCSSRRGGPKKHHLRCSVFHALLNKITKHAGQPARSSQLGAGEEALAPETQRRALCGVRYRPPAGRRTRTFNMEDKMKSLVVAAGALASLALGASGELAQGKTITLCWAACDPANALVELSKDFTAKTGTQMKFEFVPWPNFADRMLNELNSKGKLCDLMIGDSQWIGGAAENGNYVKLNEFFEKNNISMSDFMPATVTGYSEWPKNTPNYWALPAMGDAIGWTYRKDWFARPELQAEFKEKHGRDLAPPKTY